jgi:hypothetical protein
LLLLIAKSDKTLTYSTSVVDEVTGILVTIVVVDIEALAIGTVLLAIDGWIVVVEINTGLEVEDVIGRNDSTSGLENVCLVDVETFSNVSLVTWTVVVGADRTIEIRLIKHKMLILIIKYILYFLYNNWNSFYIRKYVIINVLN